MKMDRQIAVLRALGRLSGPRKEKVDGVALSKAIGGVTPATVVLSNRFFVDANWITIGGKGLYSATDALIEYNRRLATGAPDPAGVLRTPARQSWFWDVLEPYLASGPLALNEAAILLMRAVDATESHMPMITNLVAWMEHVGLVSVGDGFVTAKGSDVRGDDGSTGGLTLAEGPEDAARHDDPVGTGEASPDHVKPNVHADLPPEPLVAFGLDIKLMVADLAKLSPEQIRAFFEAVGTLAALQNKG